MTLNGIPDRINNFIKTHLTFGNRLQTRQKIIGSLSENYTYFYVSEKIIGHLYS